MVSRYRSQTRSGVDEGLMRMATMALYGDMLLDTKRRRREDGRG